MKQVKRDKAFLGAILGIASLAGSLISGGLSARAQAKSAQAQADAIREQNRQNRITANQQNTMQAMQNMNTLYNNQDYLDDYYNRFNTSVSSSTQTSLRCGGRKKIKKCGGRNKANFGTQLIKFNDAGGFSTLGNLASGIIGGISTNNAANIANSVKPEYYRTMGVNIAGYSGDGFRDRFLTFKCGGKKRK